MFLQAQGYNSIEENIFEQDNESAIKLERQNRCTFAGPKSRHINILRYFWMKDRLKGEDLVVRRCPISKGGVILYNNLYLILI